MSDQDYAQRKLAGEKIIEVKVDETSVELTLENGDVITIAARGSEIVWLEVY